MVFHESWSAIEQSGIKLDKRRAHIQPAPRIVRIHDAANTDYWDGASLLERQPFEVRPRFCSAEERR